MKLIMKLIINYDQLKVCHVIKTLAHKHNAQQGFFFLLIVVKANHSPPFLLIEHSKTTTTTLKLSQYPEKQKLCRITQLLTCMNATHGK